MSLFSPQLTARFSGMTLVLLMAIGTVFAAGTKAGTRIFNAVEVSFQLESAAQTLHVERASHAFVVSELIRSNVSSLNPEGVAAATPAQDVPLSFQVTNTGNGTETFNLTPQTGSQGDFAADITRTWLESNGTPGLQSDDTPYNPATGVTLDADEGVTVYLVSDIPAGLADQSSGDVMLQAISATESAKNLLMGEALPTGGDGGIEAVVAQDNATSQDTSQYVVSGVRLKVNKEVASVTDPYQGNLVMSGAEITYRITVQAEGVGLAKGLKINDPAPANMSYKVNSLALNGLLLTDGQDSDDGYFDSTTNIAWFTPGDVLAPSTQVYTLTYIVD